VYGDIGEWMAHGMQFAQTGGLRRCPFEHTLDRRCFMGWGKSFLTKMFNPGTNSFDTVPANVKTNSDGHVTDFIHHTHLDTPSQKNHGHVWGLAEPKIGGRPESSGSQQSNSQQPNSGQSNSKK
jgi:hypothetical protein